MSALDFGTALREARAQAKAEALAVAAAAAFFSDSPSPFSSSSSSSFDCGKLKDALPPSLCPDTDVTIRYINDFVTAEHATTLAAQLRGLSGWRMLSGRKLLSLGGTPHPGGSGVWVLPLPPFLEELANALAPVFGGEPADQLLINEYESGQGIAAHKDGPLYESTVRPHHLYHPTLSLFCLQTIYPGPSTDRWVKRCTCCFF
jgi:hypothetical protein